MSEMLLEALNITKSFGSVQVLKDITFKCAPGQIHGLIGENGAGKSTLLKILAGVFSPDQGEVRFHGETVRDFSPKAALSRGISIIFQEFSLIPVMTVAENIFVGREPLGRFGRLDRKTMRRQAEELLARVGLSIDPNRPIETLSVAEQQTVEIARALSRKSDLLILDEPTAALADQEAEKLFTILRELRAQGTSIVFVSHRLSEILHLVDVITVLKDGQLVGTDRVEAFDESRLISMMVGRDLEHTFPPKRPVKVDEPLMKVSGFTAANGAFRDVDLNLHRGEILGIAGLEGHGQSELLRSMFGLEPLASGTLAINGRTLSSLSPRRCIAEGIVFASDDRKREGLVLPFDIRENVALSTMKARQTLSFIHARAEQKQAEESIKTLQISPSRSNAVLRYLSGGNQQKVVLGRWLAAKPSVLMLAEPTRGIDVGTKIEIYNLLRKLADEGVGVIVVSRDMVELLGLSDRILVMADGRTVAELDPEHASEEEVMRAIVRGSASRTAKPEASVTVASH